MLLDLSGLDASARTAAQERYQLPAETMTYFLLRYHSPKLIEIGSDLFLATVLAAPATPQHFLLRELKIFISRTTLVTCCELPQADWAPFAHRFADVCVLPQKERYRTLSLAVEIAVASYDPIVARFPPTSGRDVPGSDMRAWEQSAQRFHHFLERQHVFLTDLAHRTEQRCGPLHGARMSRLAERVGRVVWTMQKTMRGNKRKSRPNRILTSQKHERT